MKNKSLICIVCGIPFNVNKPSQVKTRKFCSAKCHLSNLHKILIKPRKELICIRCGNKFKARTPYYERNRKYCSKICVDKYKGEHGLTRGDRNGHWKGGIHTDSSGYLRYSCGTNAWNAVHRVVMENHIGRKLFSNEIVHHIDGNKFNNELSNLQLLTRSQHMKLHINEIMAAYRLSQSLKKLLVDKQSKDDGGGK